MYLHSSTVMHQQMMFHLRTGDIKGDGCQLSYVVSVSSMCN